MKSKDCSVKPKRGKKMKKITVAVCLALLFSVSMLSMVEAKTYVSAAGGKGYIEKVSGTTEILGGGDYVGIRFMRQVPRKTAYIEDAMFAVIWEQKTKPNQTPS
jgi:hypothetical protein